MATAQHLHGFGLDTGPEVAALPAMVMAHSSLQLVREACLADAAGSCHELDPQRPLVRRAVVDAPVDKLLEYAFATDEPDYLLVALADRRQQPPRRILVFRRIDAQLL
jgi:hypothetical protein